MTVGPKDETVLSADAPHRSTGPDLNEQACVGSGAESTIRSNRAYAARLASPIPHVQSANGFGRPLHTVCPYAVSARAHRSHWSGWTTQVYPLPEKRVGLHFSALGGIT